MDGLKWLTEEYKPALLKLHEEVVNETTIKKIFSNLEVTHRCVCVRARVPACVPHSQISLPLASRFRSFST